MKKITIILLMIAITVTCLVSCGKDAQETLPDEAVPVLSNYPNLEYILPGEYDTSKFEDGTNARYGYSTIVSEVNGQLAIMPTHTCGCSRAPYIAKSVVYKFGDISGSDNGVYTGDKLLISQKCVGMVHSYGQNNLLVFTTTEDSGTVYNLEKEYDTGEMILPENNISIDGKILLIYYEWDSMFYDAPDKIYVVTSEGVSILHTDEYLNSGRSAFTSIKVEQPVTPEWWKYMRPTNATQTKDGTVWVGEREGVIAINTDGSMEYYPIDYLNVIYGN